MGWLILCSNAFNLIDGVDGLATGVGITATLTTLIAGILHGDVALGLATAPLAGCLIGFLRYNFNPASIFLGDSGSLLIGFLLGSYGIIWSQKSATMLGVAAPALALGLPLLEVGLSIVRRFVRNDPIFEGDRGHIHHRLLDRGFTPRRVALLMYGACGVAATLSLLQSVVRGRLAGLGIVFFAGITWVGVRYLGYAEFDAARRFLSGGFRPILSAHVTLELLERSLSSASTVEECWSALEQAARSLGYSHMTARLGAARFATAPDRGRNGSFWQFRLNLKEDCWVNITQQECGTEQPVLLMPFTEVVRRALPKKISELCAGSPSPAAEPEASLANLATATAAPRPSLFRAELQDHDGDVVRLRRALGKRGDRFLNGIVNRRAAFGGMRRHLLAKALLAEEPGLRILGLRDAIGIDHHLVSGRELFLRDGEFDRHRSGLPASP